MKLCRTTIWPQDALTLTVSKQDPLKSSRIDVGYWPFVLQRLRPIKARLTARSIIGLTAPIFDAEGFNVNIVNAKLVAKERGIFVNEQKSR